jgi:hypothetical protein
MNNALERMWKEAFVAFHKVVSGIIRKLDRQIQVFKICIQISPTCFILNSRHQM